ncbi:porin [Variovorax sp. GB1P17]|uniref:porin n=1 Tax=Variovorax sp. GB1P17 TaxID=3443740 RepID=UPI003F46B69E
MKKTMLALAVLSPPGLTMAQSSVAVFGVVDVGVARISGSNGHRTGLTNSGQSYSRLGFRGTEDLGGGLAASFHLEGQLHNDVGMGADQTSAYNFARRSTVSLSGKFGEIRIGRDFTPTFWNTTLFDPWGGNGVGGNELDAQLANAPGGINGGKFLRNSNAVSYFLPANLGGFYGQFQHAFGENASTVKSKAGNYNGLRLGYAKGKVNVSVSSGKYSTGADAASGGLTATNLGASYDFGVARLSFAVAHEKALSGPVVTKQLGWLLGVTVPVGVGELRAAYSSYDRKKSPNDYRKLAIGYGHNLSKRTQIYGTYARVTNKGSSDFAVSSFGLNANDLNGPGGTSKGIEFGIRHAF